MNLQPAVQSRSSANGFGRRRVEREIGPRLENKSIGKTSSNRSTNAGLPTPDKGAGYESPSRDRLVYLTTCLVGHQVEVQVVDGSIFSGIFHATNADQDFGIILKMARLAKAGSLPGQKNISHSVGKPPSKTLIIPAKELVQITAKGVPITKDALTNELKHEKLQELMTDSYISQSRHVEVERELERWVPDEDVPECPELENIFDGPWNRGWDQFEANETLFGVKSTFNEDLYTTKLERGPQMRELEREASKLAREIEGEETRDLHLAEERGLHLHADFEIDEETRFSSVIREVDDSGYDENEDILLDSHNSETFGAVSDSVINKPFTDMTSGKSIDAQVSSSSSLKEVQSSQLSSGRELPRSSPNDNATHLSSEYLSQNSSGLDGESRIQDNQADEQHAGSNYDKSIDEAQKSKMDDNETSLRLKSESSDKFERSPNATSYAPPSVSPKVQEKTSSLSEPEGASSSVKAHGAIQSVNSRARPITSASSTPDSGFTASASSRPVLSPSSSVGSLSSDKSILNPHAKEFRLNPNAKSFVPSQTSVRPASPVSDGTFYYQSNMAAVPQMHGMPVGIGPVMFSPQGAPMQSQPYFHPNGQPQYGQQMLMGHPRQVVYMPTYPPEMQYKGRDF